ncbi:MAG: ABC transporter ATP-binding protein [Atopobiaceae bacterium]|jgi:peptide/nickel transport system ATP-binding protein
MSEHLLEIQDLSISFVQRRAAALEAVHKVSLSINPGEMVGIVGESGCGKSVLAQSVMRLLEYENNMAYEGSIFFDGTDLLKLPLKNMQKVRGSQIAMIFQDPLSSLNPVMTIGAQIVEALLAHVHLSKNEARSQALDLLKRVGIAEAERRFDMFPSDFSGGMRQRVMIAMALAGHPRLLIADEPTTALDTTTQKQILDLLRELNQTEHMAILLISHDLGVVSTICTSVNVMYLGQIVERTSAQDLMQHPNHPYTQGLIKSVPPLYGEKKEQLEAIPGTVPPLTNIPSGCRYAPRCPFAQETCHTKEPPFVRLDNGSYARCWLAEEGSMYE